jgi:hypothetical protein
VADAIHDAVEAAAVIVVAAGRGGSSSGRTFHRRADIEVDGELPEQMFVSGVGEEGAGFAWLAGELIPVALDWNRLHRSQHGKKTSTARVPQRAFLAGFCRNDVDTAQHD